MSSETRRSTSGVPDIRRSRGSSPVVKAIRPALAVPTSATIASSDWRTSVKLAVSPLLPGLRFSEPSADGRKKWVEAAGVGQSL